MKKLIAMMAALATGFFAFGDDATPSNAKATFETDQGYVAGTTISNLTEEGSNTYYWLLEEGADEESGTVTEYAEGAAKPTDGGDQYLAVETGAQPIYRSITKHDSSKKTLADLTAVDISDTGIFLDSQVKFTPSAENPTYTAGTKLIVWAQEIEADPDNEIEAATNLVVTAGSYADPMAQAVFKLVVPENFDFTAWHRLTIRAIKDVTDGSKISGFCIFVDGVQVAADATDYATKIAIDKSALTTMGGKFYDKQQLFLSCAVANVDNQALRAFGVQGSGAVDNLAAYDKDNAKQNCSFALGEIQFAVVYTDTEIASFAASFEDGTEIPAAQIGAYTDGKKIITVDGSVEKIKVAVTPATGYMIVNDEPSPWTLETASESFTVLTKKIGFVVDGVNFPEDDFDGALAAAQLAGVPLTLAQNFTFDVDNDGDGYGPTITADTIIDLNGKTFAFKGVNAGAYDESNGFFVSTEGVELTIVDSQGGGSVTTMGEFDAPVVMVGMVGGFILGDGTDKGAKIDGQLFTLGGDIKLVNGYVNKTLNPDVTAWLAEGKEAIDNGDGFWKIAPIQATPFAIILADGTTKYFGTLEEAIAAAGTTVDEVTYPSTVTLMGNCERADWILINKTVTIDLNGNSITVPDVDAFRANDATNAKRDSLFVVLHGGALTIDDTSVAQTGLVDVSSDTRINSVVKMTKPGDTDDTLVAAFTLNAGTLKGSYYGITGNGNPGRGNTAITINGGTIIACNPDDNAGIYNPQAGTLTINGGTIEGATGVYIKAGECVCSVSSEATIKGNGNQHDYQPSGNGIHSTGDAIVLDNMGYPGGDPNANIAGGTFVSANGAAVASYSDPKKPALAPITGFVTGGTFTGAVKIDDAIAGGTFAFGPFEPGVPQTPVAAVAKIGDVNYASLAAAVAAAVEGDEVTLIDNITLTATTEIDTALALNLNGKTITYTGCSGLCFTADGIVSNGTVSVVVENNDNKAIAIEFLDADGLVQDVAVNSGNAKYGVVASSNENFGNKLVECENVDATGSGMLFYAESNEMTLDADCTGTQTGAYAQGQSFSPYYSGTLAAGWLGELTVNGGTYTAEGRVVSAMSSPATIKINAGTFTGDFNLVPVSDNYKVDERFTYHDHIVVISGGDFSDTEIPVSFIEVKDGFEASWAASETVQNYVTPAWTAVAAGNFQVGTKKFATLAAALADEATVDGSTIELLDNETSDAVTINKAITLDLGDKALTGTALTISANVTITNGVLEMLAGASEEVMAITSGKTILAADATIKTHGTYQLTLGAATFDIYGTLIGDDQGVDEGGQAAVLCESADGVINVYDGANVDGANDTFRLKYGATLNVYGGTLTSRHNWPIVYAYKTGTPSTVNVYGGIFNVNVGGTGSATVIGAFRIKDDAVVTPLDATCTAKFSSDLDDDQSTKKWATDFLKPGYALKEITEGADAGYYQIAAQYALTFTAEGADDVVVKFFEGDTVQAPEAPKAPAGKKFDGWKDSAGTLVDAGANITPAAANATYTAQFSDAGIGPGEEKPVEGNDEETARENAQKLPIVLTEEQVKAGMTTDYLINNVKSNGTGGFVAFVDVNKAAIEDVTGMPIGLDTTAEEPLKVDAENVTAKVKTVAGVWYGMDEAGELTGAEFDPVVSTYVIGNGETMTFTIPKKANATKAFYKVGVRVVKPATK